MLSEADPFDGPVTLVTGGGSGIGAALCRRLASPGRAFLVHTGSNHANAERVASDLRAAGAAAAIHVADYATRPWARRWASSRPPPPSR
jgi:NAD(P)-dependent dehydrogenase (short-subunit alcohol dehydrogenase family)